MGLTSLTDPTSHARRLVRALLEVLSAAYDQSLGSADSLPPSQERISLHSPLPAVLYPFPRRRHERQCRRVIDCLASAASASKLTSCSITGASSTARCSSLIHFTNDNFRWELSRRTRLASLALPNRGRSVSSLAHLPYLMLTHRQSTSSTSSISSSAVS